MAEYAIQVCRPHTDAPYSAPIHVVERQELRKQFPAALDSLYRAAYEELHSMALLDRPIAHAMRLFVLSIDALPAGDIGIAIDIAHGYMVRIQRIK